MKNFDGMINNQVINILSNIYHPDKIWNNRWGLLRYLITQ